ncbi:MAG: hypothetical protein U0P82_09210 [Vicinamibacterales bacterium]
MQPSFCDVAGAVKRRVWSGKYSLTRARHSGYAQRDMIVRVHHHVHHHHPAAAGQVELRAL